MVPKKKKKKKCIPLIATSSAQPIREIPNNMHYIIFTY